MDPKRTEHLIAGYLGDSLSEAEAAELWAAVRQPGEMREELLRHLAVDRLVRETGRPAVDPDRVLRAVASQRTPAFADRVLSKLGEPSPRAASRRRIARRLRSGGSRRFLPPAFAAAVLLAVGVSLALLPSKSGPGKPAAAVKPPLDVPERPSVVAHGAAETPARVPTPPRPAGSTPRSDSAIGRETDPRPAAVPEPKPDPPPRTEPRPGSKPARPTRESERQVVAATLRRLRGTVLRIEGNRKAPIERGEGLPAGQGILTDGPESRALLFFEDKTIVVMEGDTTLLEVKGGAEKSLRLERGKIGATIARQPSGRPMAFRTPHALVTVLGTVLHLSVSGGATRLEVEKGYVRMKRFPDGASVEVRAGQFAVAGGAGPLEAKRIIRTLMFQDGAFPTPDYAGTRDTSIGSEDPDSNSGALEALRLYMGAERQNAALLKWDVSSIPRGSRVVSVEMTLSITGSVEGSGYAVYPARQPWVESEATWRVFAAGRRWQVAGAKADQDRGSRALGTLRPPGTGVHTLLFDDRGIAVVQSWVNNPAANFGIVVAGESPNNEWDLQSREAARVGKRPRLTVTYVPPARR